MRRGRTRVKICGITSEASMRAAVEAGADAVGLVLAEGSPRRLDREHAVDLARGLPPFVVPVAVFRNQPASAVIAWPGPCLQLHGREDRAYMQRLRDARPDAVLVRGFEFAEPAVRHWSTCPNTTALLIDGSPGGHGVGFDHDALARWRATLDKPVILAGGLTPENVGPAIHTVAPFAVDVSSGVESSPGVKDLALIRAFCEAVHAADAGPHS